MVFGWGDPDPDPEMARRALERYQQAVSLLEDGDAESAWSAIEDAAELGADAHTDEGRAVRARACTLGALVGLEARHDRRAWLEAALDAGRNAPTPEALVAAAHAAYRLGRLDDEAGRVQAAVDRHREAFDLGQQADTEAGDEVAALASLEAGRLLHQRGRFAESTEALEHAVAFGDALPDPASAEVRARARMLLGRVHRDGGDRTAAIAAYEDAVEIGRSGSPAARRLAAQAAWSLADLHGEQGREDAVGRWYSTATDEALAAGDAAGIELAARIHLAWASMHQQAGREDEASQRYADAARQADRAGTQEGGELARTARSRNVKLASGLAQAVEVPTSPDPGPPADPRYPEDPRAAPEEPMPEEPTPPTPDPSANGAPDDATVHASAAGASPEDDVEPSPEPSAGLSDEEEVPASPGPAGTDRGDWPSAPGARGALVDRAETLHELGLKRGDEDCMAEAVRLIDEALEASPRDPDLVHRRARLAATLARWREDEDALEDALGSFERAFELHGGRVNPTTHQPGPNFFFDWGRTTYELAQRRGDAALHETAHERLSTGYEMQPRGARHLVASALMARCRFGLAEASDDAAAYEQVVDRYEALEEEGPFALEHEDEALWARALFALAEAEDDPGLYGRAFDRMRRAYERR